MLASSLIQVREHQPLFRSANRLYTAALDMDARQY
jgi:hypothetical protein